MPHLKSFMHALLLGVAHASLPTLAAPATSGIPTFADLFQGGAVLQRDTAVSVWGTISGDGPVALYIDKVHLADASVVSGEWKAQLKPQQASFGKAFTAVGPMGNTTVKVSFGDVLLCSGQSNMDMPLWNKPGGFQADNGTAEVTAADRYTGGIWLWKQVQSKYRNPTAWETASMKALKKIPSFSALCWYTGKNHYERFHGQVPVGLLQASVSGSPIEYWLSAETLAKCETDKPQCKPGFPDSSFHDDQIVSLLPYTVGAIVWDQAERDVIAIINPRMRACSVNWHRVGAWSSNLLGYPLLLCSYLTMPILREWVRKT
jgi:sialate O-acetylesterase